MKLALGTVQFGMNYGINNSLGKPTQETINTILSYAYENQIRLLDCSNVYGDAEERIGEYHQNHSHFDVVSKFICDEVSLENKISMTLEKLKIDSLYGYLFHRVQDFKNNKDHFKKTNPSKIKKWGVSLYSIEDFKEALNTSWVEIIQIPYNLFDSTDEKENLFKIAKTRGIEIHVRSIFLQGIFYKNVKQLTGNLTQFKKPLDEMKNFLNQQNISTESLCLSHAKKNHNIDRIIIGVDSLEQLKNNLNHYKSAVSEQILTQLPHFKLEDESLLNPANWRP